MSPTRSSRGTIVGALRTPVHAERTARRVTLNVARLVPAIALDAELDELSILVA
jgi:hypothetical protein